MLDDFGRSRFSSFIRRKLAGESIEMPEPQIAGKQDRRLACPGRIAAKRVGGRSLP